MESVKRVAMGQRDRYDSPRPDRRTGVSMSTAHYSVSPPIEATTLLVDLRNFTPNLNAAERDASGINTFCHFLSYFYSLCLDAVLVALPAEAREEPPVYIGSTGDGVLVIVYHEDHVRIGYLTALVLNAVLRQLCEHYNRERGERSGCPDTSFGIGMESGDVCRVEAFSTPGRPPLVDTYIGECINVAARAEGVSKLYDRSNVIIAEQTNELLSQAMFETSYAGLIREAIDESLPDEARLAAQDRMNEINRALCMTFMHHHNLKGVNQPMPLFRIAHGSAVPGNPRFDELVRRLTDDGDRHADVLRYVDETPKRFGEA